MSDCTSCTKVIEAIFFSSCGMSSILLLLIELRLQLISGTGQRFSRKESVCACFRDAIAATTRGQKGIGGSTDVWFLSPHFFIHSWRTIARKTRPPSRLLSAFSRTAAYICPLFCSVRFPSVFFFLGGHTPESLNPCEPRLL